MFWIQLQYARLDEYFGFTQKDVDKILSDAGVTEYAGQVKEWYDGYHFGTNVMYIVHGM